MHERRGDVRRDLGRVRCERRPDPLGDAHHDRRTRSRSHRNGCVGAVARCGRSWAQPRCEPPGVRRGVGSVRADRSRTHTVGVADPGPGCRGSDRVRSRPGARRRCSRRTARGCSRCRSRRGSELGEWWSPAQRGVLPLDGLDRLPVAAQVRTAIRGPRRHRVHRSCGGLCRPGPRRCLDRRGDHHGVPPAASTRLGHSVETWLDGELVGGLYGIAIAGLFAGESMFSHSTDASKVALVHLVDLLRDEYARTAGSWTRSGRRTISPPWVSWRSGVGLLPPTRRGAHRAAPAGLRLTDAWGQTTIGSPAVTDHRPLRGGPLEHPAVEVHRFVGPACTR